MLSSIEVALDLFDDFAGVNRAQAPVIYTAGQTTSPFAQLGLGDAYVFDDALATAAPFVLRVDLPT